MRTRTWKTFVAAALLCPTLAFVGCNGTSTAGGEDGAEKKQVILSEPVAILEKKAGNSEALSLGVVLIQTQEQYDALGDKDIYPGVDFEKQDLVIAALGEQKTGGYAIDITALQVEGDTIFVQGKATAPAADAVTTQALTYPYAAAVINNTMATKVVSDID